MSSAAATTPLSTTPIREQNLVTELAPQPASASTSAAGCLLGRHLSHDGAPSSGPAVQALAAAGSGSGQPASGSIRERPDGSPRVIQRSYWSQGVWIGIYYI